MALTTAKICALLLGGAVAGSYGTVAVQKAKAPVAKVKGKPGKAAAKRAVVSPSTVRPASPPSILDCPFPSVPALDGSLEYRLEPAWSEPWPQGSFVTAQPPLNGGTFPPASPHVPEPDVWVMLVAGFGLVGVSLRKKGTEHGTV